MVECIQSYKGFFRDIYVFFFFRLAMRCDCMSSIARLISVCQKEQISSFDKREIPINIDENLRVKLIFKKIIIKIIRFFFV